MYPLFLDLAGRRAVVVGGGCVAARRIRGLTGAGADVEVIAPEVCGTLRAMIDDGHVRWTPRRYRPGDLMRPEPAWLVHTATGIARTDALVTWEAAASRIWCVNAADHHRSAAWTPAVARGAEGTDGDGVTVAVSGGGDPRRARAIRDAVAGLLAAGALPVGRIRPGAPETLVAHSQGSPGA